MTSYYTYEHKYRLAQAFAKRFKNEKRERAEKDTFWNEFFAIFGLDRFRTATTEYAIKHRGGSTKFADVFWAGRLLCEHKSAGRDLDDAFQQAMEYVEEIRRHNPDDVPRHVIVSDFATIQLFDLQDNTSQSFTLEELPEQIKLRNFDFMDGISHALKEAEEQANIEAASAVGKLYSAFKADGNYAEHDLKQFMIRLLFCFFADDTLIFAKNQFEDYLTKFSRADGEDLGGTLNRLFTVLNTPSEKRPNGMNSELKAFPYVNGKLFEEQLSEFYFNSELRDLLLECSQRDWAKISPEIFGNLFQSVMNNVERRELGAHYTEEANIIKVINGLFMDDLHARFQAACKTAKKDRPKAINELHEHIGKLNFLDPACGCGNFLVVAYRELRKLEDDIIGELYSENQLLDISTMVKIRISQFHGMEIDEYPAQIAKVAMWLTDHQCNLRTAERFGQTRPSIPLTDSAEILCTNALREKWASVDYIFGNPPFIGHSWRSKEQQDDCELIFPKDSKFGKMDYVANWYVKAARQIFRQPETQAAFVSTNSICQGEQAGVLWKWMFEQGLEIHFAHRTFQWTSQAAGKAAVHCVIVGFRHTSIPPLLAGEGWGNSGKKYLFDYPDIKGQPEKREVANINQYLAAGASVIIASRAKPQNGMEKMTQGSKFVDGGKLILSPTEKLDLERRYPILKAYIKPLIGAEELINGKKRYCLWFANAKPSELAQIDKIPEMRERKEAIKEQRLKSPTPLFQKSAATPYVVTENRQPETNFLAMPRVSSESRYYIPIDFLTPDNIISDRLGYIANATEYEFGVLISAMHMDWMRTVAGRLESRYSYDANVYHSFPFPEADAAQKAQIVKLAQAVLAARKAEMANDPSATLATLYNPDIMPASLRKAHAALDKAVDKLYRAEKFGSEAERVGFLFDLYEKRKAV
ncbi:DNA methyltransferase [Neisseria chenwenguii]|uniref:DNA methyltransferase n=1 Tax=Neisseria chenwenguii TaxID=1853278 RepID=UPI000F4E4379|nr:DNA methyltransferase [Neisseria chenwenguii]ROV56968.1 class I SAM-dependent DNA methyltransferase [Neisseria chenwenguii]